MASVIGTHKAEQLAGTSLDDVMQGNSGKDTIAAGDGNDVVRGGQGDDRISGDNGNDVLIGSKGDPARVDMNNMKIAEDTTARITFGNEEAGFKNTLGMYKIAADGTITGVDILFANASLKGSGGDLIGGKSFVDVDLKAGDRVGFFVAPNAFSMKGMDKLLADEKGSFKMVDAKGNPATINGGEVFLVHVAANGKETVITTQYGKSIFHSVDGASGGLNGDKFNHVKGMVDSETGKIKVGFEDLWKGGDKDFDDSVFTVDLGVTNALLLGKQTPAGSKHSDNDTIAGGDGNDQIFGMAGNDRLSGGTGDDKMWGNSGNDALNGDAGNDRLFGGKGDDVLDGGEGNDAIDGGSGNDLIKFSAGADQIKGGSGSDTLSFAGSTSGVEANLQKHFATDGETGKSEVWGVENLVGSAFDDKLSGDKRDNIIDGGAGDDVLRGMGGADTLFLGEGDDRVVFFAKDVVGQDGKSLGVDTVYGFGVGDVLDLRNVAGGDASAISLKSGTDGTHVYANIGGTSYEVAVLRDYQADGVV
ncbi:MAG: hypothetical protein RL291_1722, partial [Pseudomonadota bacterium]